MELTAPGVLDLGVVLLLAAAGGWIARRLTLPAVVGYLAVGLAISPFTPGYVADREQLTFLADVGVVLLLFEVGIEVDLARIWRDHGAIAWAAPLQVGLTTTIATAVLMAGGLPGLGAAFVGLGVAMSSSVVIVNITRSRRRTTDPDTELALVAWSVLQDVTGVAISVLLLAVAGASERPLSSALLGGVAFTGIAIGVALLLPHVLRRLEAEGDLFLIVSVAVGLALAGIGAGVAGIPIALAAFVGGLAIVEGPEAAEVRRRLLPFRDLLAVLFFVLLGSLIDPAALGRGLSWLAVLVALVIVAKSALAAGLARVSRMSAHHLQLGVGLGQAGEFSFVLASAALAHRLVPQEVYAAVLGTVVITIVASTVLVRLVRSGSPTRVLPAEG